MNLDFTVDPLAAQGIHRRALARAEGGNVILTFPVNGEFLNLTMSAATARQVYKEILPVTNDAETFLRKNRT